MQSGFGDPQLWCTVEHIQNEFHPARATSQSLEELAWYGSLSFTLPLLSLSEVMALFYLTGEVLCLTKLIVGRDSLQGCGQLCQLHLSCFFML